MMCHRRGRKLCSSILFALMASPILPDMMTLSSATLFSTGLAGRSLRRSERSISIRIGSGELPSATASGWLHKTSHRSARHLVTLALQCLQKIVLEHPRGGTLLQTVKVAPTFMMQMRGMCTKNLRLASDAGSGEAHVHLVALPMKRHVS